MYRLRSLVVIGALTLAVCMGAGPASAAKGGNNDTAKACQHGGWMTLVPVTGDAGAFANQGDCVNDGAHGLGVPPAQLDPQTVCLSLPSGQYTPGSDGILFTCSWESPPDSSSELEAVCGMGEGELDTQVDDGTVKATCFAHE